MSHMRMTHVTYMYVADVDESRHSCAYRCLAQKLYTHAHTRA